MAFQTTGQRSKVISRLTLFFMPFIGQTIGTALGHNCDFENFQFHLLDCLFIRPDDNFGILNFDVPCFRKFQG